MFGGALVAAIDPDELLEPAVGAVVALSPAFPPLSAITSWLIILI